MKELRQGAILRSAIIAEVTASKEPLSINDLLDKPSVKAAMKSKEHTQNLLKNMYDSGQLSRVRISRPGDMSIYAYEKGNGVSQLKSAIMPPVIDQHKLNIKVGKHGDYVDLTIKGVHLHITIGD
jgi:hypothetical protein